MATYRAGCSSVGGYSYAGNFSLYVELNDTNTNIGNNTSQVQYNVYCRSNGSGSISATHTIAFTLNGQQIINQTKSISASSPNANIPIANGSLTVTHNSDGTKSVSFSASIQARSYGVSASLSNTFNLNTIPRASSITCTTANVEETAIININSASSGFRHNVRYGFGNLSSYILNNVAGGSHSWVIPSSFYAQFPNQKTTQGTLWCETYSNGSKIGESIYIFTVTTSESRCKPTLSASVKDTNATTKALTGSESKLIKYKSTAQVTINASAKNSATISSKKVNNQTVSGTTISYSNVEATSFTVTVTDSRGYSTSTTLKPTVVNYVPLSINASFFRPQPTTGQISLSFTGNYFNGNFGATNNTLSIQWQWKESTSSTWTTGGTITPTISGNTYKSNGNISLGTSYNYQKSYNFRLIVKDKLVTLQPTYTVSVGKPIVDWGKDFFNVNGSFRLNDTSIYDLLVSGGTLSGPADFNDVKSGGQLNHCFVGSIRTSDDWYNLINVRHRNGTGDGTDFGLQIRNGLNYTKSKLQLRQQAYKTWGAWRTIQEEPTSLYDNSNGSNGSITLSETSANFKFLEIYFKNDDGLRHSSKIYSPNGTMVQLETIDGRTNSSEVCTKVRTIKISGTSITTNTALYLNYGEHTSLNNKYLPNNKIYITKVLGYR